MIDLSQAIISEADFDKKQLIEPSLFFCPAFISRRGERGKYLEGTGGSTAIILGYIMLALGLALLLDAYELISLGESKNPPVYVVYLNVLTDPMAIGFILWGKSHEKKRKILEKNKILKPNSPWFGDYIWEDDGIRDDSARNLMGSSIALYFGFWILIPLGWAIYSGWANFSMIVQWIIIGISTWVLYVYIRIIILAICEAYIFFNHGSSKLQFIKFPFLLSERFKGKLENLPENLSRMTLDLRFIIEEHEQHGKNYTFKFFQLFKQTKVLTKVPQQWDGSLLIEWELPNRNDFFTNLNAHPSQYWELEVRAETPRIDYYGRFLLPIYAKP